MLINSGLIKKTEPKYPLLLREIYNSPEQLYYKGDISLINQTCISIVGTRKYTEYGERVTKDLVRDLSSLNICIVSGLAIGIDTIAHQAAIENNIPTIAVLGNGIDYIYPRVNQKLGTEILKNGLILSEYPDNKEPLPFQFVSRNRIVSGLSIALIVVEAPQKSGALITAKLALEQGREIFVVPGDIDRKNSEGCINLLQNSCAYPIKSAADVIEVLKRQPHLFRSENLEKKRPRNFKQKVKTDIDIQIKYNLSDKQIKILDQMSSKKVRNLEYLVGKLGMTIQELLTEISVLEIKSLIKTKNGGYIRKYAH